MTNITTNILLCAIMLVESGGNPLVWNYKEDALGPLQIRPVFVDDVNRIVGRSAFTYDDRRSVLKSMNMAVIYFQHYGEGKTPQDLARMFNGGPDGWKEETTLPYWEKVKTQIEKFYE